MFLCQQFEALKLKNSTGKGLKNEERAGKKKNFFHGSQCRASTACSYAELTILVVILSTIRDSVIVDS